MTRTQWPELPQDGKDFAVLFRVEGGDGSQIRQRLSCPASVLFQFEEKGSYRSKSTLDDYE
eukprot:12729419-Alexandrium_andersonii.AAC.1